MRRTLVVCFLALLAGACAAPAPIAAPAPTASTPQISLSFSPNPPSSSGETELILEVRDGSDKPVNGAEVVILATMSGHGMDPLQGPATDQGNGRYSVKAPLDMAGDWTITVEVRQTGQTLASQDFTVSVQ